MDTEIKKKRPVRTALILATFVFVVAAVALLSVKIVNNVPGSFASLASLAESVKDYQEKVTDTESNQPQDMLIVTSDTNVVVAGEKVRLSWTETTSPGSYVFSYGCTDGVAIDIDGTDGARSISCGTNYNLGNVNNVSLKIDSSKARYADIPYTLAFLATSDTEPRASDDAVLTVVNAQIADVTVATAPEPEVEVEAEVPETVVETPEESTTETPDISVPTTPSTPTIPTYTQEYTYQIPVSNPNGRTDLATRYLNVGRIVNNTFVAQTVDNDLSGAIQFEVKNLGTKTSGDWTYSVTLPSGGVYESVKQDALKPNERAIITIGFPDSTVLTHDFVVKITTANDSASLNNSFTQKVNFVE